MNLSTKLDQDKLPESTQLIIDGQTGRPMIVAEKILNDTAPNYTLVGKEVRDYSLSVS